MYSVNIKNEEDSNDHQPSPAVGRGQGSANESRREGKGEYSPIVDGKTTFTAKLNWESVSTTLVLAYQSFGVVYGDLSTSPLYVYKSIFVGKLQDHRNPDAIFGAFSLIFWTLTLIPLLKYVIFVLSADDNGEGGTFALYSLLCRYAKFSLLPNQQAADEELSTYRSGPSRQSSVASPLRKFIEKHKKSRTILLLMVLFGASMVIGDGVITPAISVLSSLSGLEAAHKELTQGVINLIACIILVGLFALQHFGTRKVAFLFAPVVVIWLLTIFGIGLYNITYWNPKIVTALSPHYIIKFFEQTGKDGFISLGGVLLSITGTEAMFADIGHFTALPIRIAFSCIVYPCLVVQYMGQAAFLSKNIDYIPRSFYASIPEAVFWPVFAIATLASIVGSQAIITATFSLVKQCHALGCFPRVKVVHTSKNIYGQIYIPEINWILMLCFFISFSGILFLNCCHKCLWSSLHDSDVHHNVFNGTCDSFCLAKKHPTCSGIPLIWHHRRSLPFCRTHEGSARWMGFSCSCFCVFCHHVCLALWNPEEVQL
ncbi:hypothetical protein Leryth_003812 [Lithospermum erythrorhizon]|nr:hypothetical protein Leryth_003812 [Lithospermum erythrorhizon]